MVEQQSNRQRVEWRLKRYLDSSFCLCLLIEEYATEGDAFPLSMKQRRDIERKRIRKDIDWFLLRCNRSPSAVERIEAAFRFLVGWW